MDQCLEKNARFGRHLGNIQFTVFLYIFLLQIQGHYEQEVLEEIVTTNEVYYPGYPGTPQPRPGHEAVEQSPGYAHPYLPGLHTSIHIEDFLWTGGTEDGQIEENGIEEEIPEESDPNKSFGVISEKTIPVIAPTSVYITRLSTVYTTIIQPTPVYLPFPGSTLRPDYEGSGGLPSVTFSAPDPPARHSQPHNHTPGETPRTHDLKGNGVDFPSPVPLDSSVTSNGYYDMPKPEYLIRTVIKNGTDLLKRSVDIHAFKRDMEERLTRTYRQAYDEKENGRRKKRSASLNLVNRSLSLRRRVIRATPENNKVRVRIHNIRSARPEPEIEILYAVYEDEKDPVLAVDAVKVVDENVGQDEAVLLLGHALKIKAEPYLKAPVEAPKSSSDWLIASVILAIFLALLLIWVLFLVYKQYWGRNEKKHDILVSSVTTSKQTSPSAPRKMSPSPFFDEGAYTLERPRSQSNYVSDQEEIKPANTNRLYPKISESKTQSRENLETVGSRPKEKRNRIPSDRSEVSIRSKHNESEGETPSLADHSSNNTPERGRKSKTKGMRRRDRRGRRGMPGTSDEDGSDSAFPARTPENVKALDDLLEEEVPIPGDSGRGSIFPGHPGWAFLPDTPEPMENDWQESAREVKNAAKIYQETLDETFPVVDVKRNVKSAKSHIFRKDKVEADISETKRNIPERPWSAQEPRWHADRMFNTKQKNWEGLSKGRKHLHHGKLLPGSTESDEEQRPKKITCWSEGASPGRPPSTITDPATPLIQAIRSELQRFQRRQNTGVTIVSDPDLIDSESRA